MQLDKQRTSTDRNMHLLFGADESEMMEPFRKESQLVNSKPTRLTKIDVEAYLDKLEAEKLSKEAAELEALEQQYANTLLAHNGQDSNAGDGRDVADYAVNDDEMSEQDK